MSTEQMTNGGTLGGGEILPYIGTEHKGIQYIDWNLVKQFAAIPLVKVLIVFLLLAICTLLIMRLFKIKTIFKGKGITSELGNINQLKSRDKFIMRSNKILSALTKFVQATPFNMPASSKEYMQYNIKRAGIKAPGGFRDLSAEEFNAIIKVVAFALVVVGVLLAVFISAALGVGSIVATIILSGILPKQILRSIVRDKDREIRENFSDFYLMLHYVLLIGGSTPLDRLMKSYAKTTDSAEMVRFVDNCVGHIDTNGEYGATTLIAKDYREIAEVGKLMRLIKQMYDGADVKQELIGFREELIKEKKYLISKRMNWLVKKAMASFNILMIILVQAILSAMALYLPDLGQITSFF